MISWVITMLELYDLKILAVDDESAICGMIYEILFGAGFRQVRTAQSCAEARRAFADFAPDAVVLDVMLPDGDGFSLIREFRRTKNVPILFLSARDADEDRLHGLGLGADDYIVKPFLPQELVLRLTAVLRRSYAAQLQSADSSLRLGDTVVDWGSGTVTRGGSAVQLTAKEYALLRKLADNRGNIVTIDALCRAAWDEENFGFENTLMVHIRRLREKMGEPSRNPRFIKTVWGVGYKID